MEMVDGMVSFDMMSKVLQNSTNSGTAVPGSMRSGSMVFLPSFGSQGVYILMGGARGPRSEDPLIDFSHVLVFDPATEQWYNQSTTGKKPDARIDLCAAGVNVNGTYDM